ncbi:MAG TPA: phosphoglucosamine mutase [Pontiella sp.]
MGKLFGTDGVRDKANQGNMTIETVMNLGRAVAFYFKNIDKSEVRPTIVVGRDPRLSGSMLEAALSAGICSAGVDVRLLGVVPTPAVATIAEQSGAVAGVMVSASHNPFFDNGIKVFKGSGYKLSDEEESAIEHLFFEESTELPLDEDVGRVYHLEDAIELYADFCLEDFNEDHPFKGMTLVLDCSNGSTSQCAGPIFSALGADVHVIHNAPNGININENCGSQDTQDLCEKVREVGADAGLAFDGDGDRLIAVDEEGNELSGDQVMAICAKAYKDAGLLTGQRVVATVMSNVGFHDAMKKQGIEVFTSGVGDRSVMELMTECDAVLGGEDSGHIIFFDVHTTGDGIISALKLIQALRLSKQPLSSLGKIMVPFPQKMINIDVREKPPIESVPSIMQAIADAESVLGDSGRVLVRYSGTQKMCRVMVEGPTEEETAAIAEKLAGTVKASIG